MAVEQARPSQLGPEDHWPAIALAYEFVRPSYEVMLKRFEVVEARIRAFLTLMGTLTLGGPIFVKAIDSTTSYTSPLFIGALSLALFILILGLFASTVGWIGVPDPGKLHEGALKLSRFDFQRVALTTAAKDFDRNRQRLERKARVTDVMAGALVLEVVLLVAWALHVI